MKKENHVYKPAGLPPGSIVYEGPKRNTPFHISVMEYDESDLHQTQFNTVEESLAERKSNSVKWINVVGIHHVGMIEQIGKMFNIHPLTLEDIVNTNSRPKFEEFNSYAANILKMLTYEDKIKSEHLSIILLKDNLVISFQEIPGDVFGFVRSRIQNGKGRIRKMGADHLSYSLLDSVIDNYFSVIEKIGDKIEAVEEELINDPTKGTMTKLHHMRRELLSLRKPLWPLRDLVSNLERSDSELLLSSTRPFLRDLQDHTNRIIDTLESQRDLVSGMMDIYLSSMSNKMNEVMKVLTIITTIFVPITFVVGVYGMNFDIPELTWSWGYPAVWGLMLAIAGSLIYYFWKKKWL